MVEYGVEEADKPRAIIFPDTFIYVFHIIGYVEREQTEVENQGKKLFLERLNKKFPRASELPFY